MSTGTTRSEPPARPTSRDGLRAALENTLPARLDLHQATAIFLYGHCFDARRDVAGIEIRVDGVTHRPAAFGMPRRDLYAMLRARGEDPGSRSYRSGFWAVVAIAARSAPGSVAVELVVRLDGGKTAVVGLGQLTFDEPEPEPEAEAEAEAAVDTIPSAISPDTIAVCLATYEPQIPLLAVQIESLRAQTDRDWTCVVSDGGSAPETVAAIRDVLGEDSRFTLSPAPRRLDPYRNFERALRLIPPEAGLIALCDQDDRWHPDKLAVLREAIGPAVLAYSDQRLVDERGRVLRESLWEGRRNEWSNIASVLVANTMPGAAMLFRRHVLDVALPFPLLPGFHYHDHWLALAALATGQVTFVDRALYDYVQHGAAVMGDVDGRPRRSAPSGSRGWRGAYFGGYVPRQIQAVALLARAGATLTASRRRGLEWFVAASERPVAFAWLALRPLRRLVGRDETLGGEGALVRGLLWRRLVAVGAGRRPRRRRGHADASFPDPPHFEQPRLRRWRSYAR